MNLQTIKEYIKKLNSQNTKDNHIKLNKIISYIRELNDEKILVVANFYDKNEEFVLDKSIKYESCEILLSNYKDSSENIEKINLRPYEAIIYKLKQI